MILQWSSLHTQTNKQKPIAKSFHNENILSSIQPTLLGDENDTSAMEIVCWNFKRTQCTIFICDGIQAAMLLCETKTTEKYFKFPTLVVKKIGFYGLYLSV